MSQNQVNSFIATTSALCGGLTKALASRLILVSITFQGALEVGFYAAISALVGYAVKKSIDTLMIKIKRRKK